MGNQLDKAFQEDEYEVTLRIRRISRGGQNKRQPQRQEQTQQGELQRQEEEEQREAQEQEVHDEQQQDDQQENEEQQQQNQNQQEQQQQGNAGVEEQGEVRTEGMQVNQQRVTEGHEQSQEQHGMQKPNGGHEEAPANPPPAPTPAPAFAPTPAPVAGATKNIAFWSNGTATTAFMSDAAIIAAAAATTAAAAANMANGFGSPYTPPTTRTSPRKSNLAAFNSTSFKRGAATSIGRTRRASSIYFDAGSNPSVHIRLLKSHLGPWFSLAIPMDFARYHFLEGRQYEIVNGQFSKYLQVEPERHGTYKLNRRLWKHFAREHNLHVGDSIRIEIVGHDQIKVHVSKRCLDLIPYQPTSVVLPKPEVS